MKHSIEVDENVFEALQDLATDMTLPRGPPRRSVVAMTAR
jgi:hypothetical protein